MSAATTTTETTIVREGSGWYIEYDHTTRDYNAYRLIDGRPDYCGSARTPDAAYSKLFA